MKKYYENPLLQIIDLSVEDILTTSGDDPYQDDGYEDIQSNWSI